MLCHECKKEVPGKTALWTQDLNLARFSPRGLLFFGGIS